MYAFLCVVSVAMCSRNPKFAIRQPASKGDNQGEQVKRYLPPPEEVVTLQDALSSR